MKIIKHKTLTTRAWLIAETISDLEVLKHLYEESICWGFYSLWTDEDGGKKLVEPELSHRIPDKPLTEDEIILQHIKKTNLKLKAVGFLSYPKNFLIMEDKKNMENKNEKNTR